MILKGSQRGGAKQLGLHLLRTDENEHVEVHEIRGFVSDDVVGALKEAYAVSKGTKAKQFLFSVSLNPPQDQDVSIDSFESAIDRIEERNGLDGQPRVIVFHEKEGRRHAHAVWSRIDAQTMTAKPLPHYRLKLRDIAKEQYLKHDWQMPRGYMDSRESDPRNFSLDEWQQAKRAGHNPRDLKAAIHECWAVSDSSQTFANALEERGLRLAMGDRRGHVAVTSNGEVFSVARSVGKKARDVRARLGEPDDLRSVEDTKAQIAKDLTPAVQRLLKEAEDKHAGTMAPLQHKRTDMAARHRDERVRLRIAQQERWDQETQYRSDRLNKGFKGLWQRLTGEHACIIKQNLLEAMEALERDQTQRERLIFDQLAERRDLQIRIRAERIAHTKQIADLHRDAALLRRGELPDAGKAKAPPARDITSTQPREKSAALKTRWDRAARPQAHADRLQRLRNKERPASTRDRGPSHEH